jgi:hypothetical protein
MTVLLVITIISAAAVTFLARFFIALCNENTKRKGRAVRIAPAAMKRHGTGKVLYMRSTTISTQAACGRR